MTEIPTPFRFIYQDECGEPGKGQEHFLVGLLRVRDRAPLYAAIRQVRESFHFGEEIKFNNSSDFRVRIYKTLLSSLAIQKSHFSFSAIAVPRRKLDLAKFSGQRHLAYNFFTKLLLTQRLHRVESAVVYVDNKTRMRPDNFLSYLHNWTNMSVGSEVIKKVESICSKTDDLIQITDLLLGCCNTKLGHPNGPRKKDVCDEAQRLRLITSQTIWVWEPKQRP
jgi:hypothetical protein